jgi:hypothetical protein
MLAYPDCAIDFRHILISLTSFTGILNSMARPQVADGGTASNMEGSYEYIK